MARSRRQKILEPLLDKWGPEIESAFLASVDLIRSDAEFNVLVARIAAGDISGALDALHIEAAAFTQFRQQLASAFAQGGEIGANSMPARYPDGNRLVVRFDGANPDAERWLRDHAATKVAEIVEDQRTMVRNALSSGMEKGINPRTMALDIVGRYDKAVGKRTGGLIGLTANQEQIVANAAEELSAGTNEALQAYLDRKVRDKRFDRYVARALKGEPIPADIQQKMVSRYKDALLKLRGDTIGRTEAMAALHRGRYQSFAQAITEGKVKPDEVKRTWQSASDSRVRHSHRVMNGQTIGFYEHYTTPNGAKLLYPGDPNGPAAEIINCRCTEAIRIDFLSRLQKRPRLR